MATKLRSGRGTMTIGAACLAVLGLLIAACERPAAQDAAKAKGPAAQAKVAPPPPAVTVSRPIVADVIEWDEYTGRFDAVASVEIRARVSGYLNEVAFRDGQTVKKGELLFVIDPRPFERAVAQAKAELEQARVKAQNASMDVERGRPLVERKIMSEKVFDDRSNVLREAEAAVKVAEAKVATAELELSFTRISAPIDGRISRAIVNPGNWISAGGAANATLLTLIVTQDPIHVYFDISENNYLKYKRLMESGKGQSMTGAPVEISLPDEQDFAHKGRLDFIDNRLDPGTATLRARALVENPRALFSPGMFARVRIAGTPLRPTVLIPDAAIGSDQVNKYVLAVAEDGTVARRSVQLGPLHAGLRVVRSGVGAEDWIVTKGLQRARPGGKVSPQREQLKISNADAPGATARD